ncbi:fatty acid desaturase [Rhizobium cremeum]|uniref:fatty acid desaturase n=1 Tax=Rhizobium cremeum TaxID=2813827 RepID=UPI000DDC3062|nr:fatty acid desaturase [Rhizobium cremeum]MCJ7997304.1 fatty acid desaturase [Rhizobium cremeum]MCJ8002398.1 fatty acid desaturase [Rhizobium cremeum]
MSANRRSPIQSLPQVRRIEWQTVVLAIVIYGGFLAVTWWWEALPILVVAVIGAWLIAWHGSLQHEVIHGHPTRNQWINDAIGWPPISLWLPYAIYKESHLIHHRDEHLTDPIEDPESYYFTWVAWNAMGSIGQTLSRWNTTLLGRLTIGPAVMLFVFLGREALTILRGDRRRAMIWVRHGLGVGVLLFWVLYICSMPFWLYFLGFVYAGAALSRLRSYAEHRYADSYEERTAIVENSPLFGLLFLHNNLHVLHHERPGVPWYQIPALYRRERDALVALNGGLLYDGYLDVARRYLLKPHHDPRHPQHS